MRAAAALLVLAALPAAAAEFRSIGERAAILYDAPSLKADRIFVASRGHPFEVLSELAADGGHDAIIVGRTGESNLKTVIFGSTASRLVQHAPVPVVVVP